MKGLLKKLEAFNKKTVKVMLALAMVFTIMIPSMNTMINAEETHTHDGYTELTNENINDYKISDTIRLDSGKYYLSGDIELNNPLVIYGDVDLCLNGHVLKVIDGIDIGNESGHNGLLNLYDCNSDTDRLFYENNTGLWVLDDDQSCQNQDHFHHVVKGGCITGGQNSHGAGLYIYKNSTLIMHAGNIVGNGVLDTTISNGGGVYNEGKFIMYGGNIVGNFATAEGAGIYNIYFEGTDDIEKFIMYGGTISHNKSEDGAAIFQHHGVLKVYGGIIEENFSEGSAVYLLGGKLIVGKSACIKDNCWSSDLNKQGNVGLCFDATIELGTQENSPSDNMEIYMHSNNNNFFFSQTISEDDLHKYFKGDNGKELIYEEGFARVDSEKLLFCKDKDWTYNFSSQENYYTSEDNEDDISGYYPRFAFFNLTNKEVEFIGDNSSLTNLLGTLLHPLGEHSSNGVAIEFNKVAMYTNVFDGTTGLSVIYDHGNKKIKIVGLNDPFPDHVWKYSVDNNVLKAKCLVNSHDEEASISLTANSAQYTGDKYTGAIITSPDWETTKGLPEATIKYVGRSNTTYPESETAPTEVGAYTAFVTVSGKTISVDFEITKQPSPTPTPTPEPTPETPSRPIYKAPNTGVR